MREGIFDEINATENKYFESVFIVPPPPTWNYMQMFASGWLPRIQPIGYKSGAYEGPFGGNEGAAPPNRGKKAHEVEQRGPC